MSLIKVTFKPVAWIARSEASLPAPGPQISTIAFCMPHSLAKFVTNWVATWAAYGVDFLEPLNPCLPADDQHIVFPLVSLMLIIVLLKLA